jgi:hypothetical protein
MSATLIGSESPGDQRVYRGENRGERGRPGRKPRPPGKVRLPPGSRQAARNEDVFRRTNEIELEESRSGVREPEFMCECSRPGCVERVHITLEEYEHVAPLHVDASIEVVIEQHTSYFVVEKLGAAGGEARRLVRRSD